MAPMAVALRRSGYRVLNVSYSSQGPSVAEIGAGLAAEIDAEVARAPTTRVHVVGPQPGDGRHALDAGARPAAGAGGAW